MNPDKIHDNQGRSPEQVEANERLTSALFVVGLVLVAAIAACAGMR